MVAVTSPMLSIAVLMPLRRTRNSVGHRRVGTLGTVYIRGQDVR